MLFALLYELVLGNQLVRDIGPGWPSYLAPAAWWVDPEVWLSPLIAFLVVTAFVLIVAEQLVGGVPRRQVVVLVVSFGVAGLLGRAAWLVYESEVAKDIYIGDGGELSDALLNAASAGVVMGMVAAGVMWVVDHMGSRGTYTSRSRGGYSSGSGPAGDVTGWPGDPRTSAVTRALCGAVYLEDWFANSVVSGVLGSRVRAIAASPGLSTSLVLQHGITAVRLRRDLEGALAGILLATVLLAFASPWLILLGLLAGAALLTYQHFAMRRRVFHLFKPDRFAEHFGRPDEIPVWAADRLEEVDRAERGNVTVFSGFYPFIGHGTAEAGWSWALPVRPTGDPISHKPTGDITPFTATELTEHVRARLATLTADPGVGERLAAVLIEDRVFAEGTSLDDRLLASREGAPAAEVDQEVLAAIAGNPEDTLRHYLAVHVPSWGGNIVASTFLRFSTNGHMLYAECERSATRPIGTNLRVDERGTFEPSFSDIADAFGKAVRGVIGRLVAAPFILVSYLRYGHRMTRFADEETEDALDDLGFDFGTGYSVRDTAAAGGWHSQFQLRDAGKHLKLVERHILEAVIDFLESHNVDTDELRRRSTTILNEGLIQTGGTNTVGALAVGSGAEATSGNVEATRP